jgi:hypothetical protein
VVWVDAVGLGVRRLIARRFPGSTPGELAGASAAVVRLLAAADPPVRGVLGAALLLASVGAVSSPVLDGLLRLAFYEQDGVRRGLGYDPDPFVAEVIARRGAVWGDDIAAHARLLVTPHPLGAAVGPGGPPGGIGGATAFPSGPVECDVVVVGSGAGGSVVAAELAEAGLSVVVLEEGAHVATESFTSSTVEMLARLYRGGGLTATVGRVPIGYAEGRCVGGSTVINGGMTFRAPERVLAGWVDACGVPGLGPDRLDACYARVERFVSAAPPDPGSVGTDQRLFRFGAERLGWRVVANTRGHVHCGGCNVCVWGCPSGAKQSALVSYLPRAVHFGAQVWADCRVDRVLFRGGRAIGVQARVRGEGTTRTVRVRARRVVVAGGALGTPALLRRSGVRGPSGQIGRNLFVHPGAQVTAVFDEPVDGWKGAHQSYQVRQFEDEGVILAAVNVPPSLVARSLPLPADELRSEMGSYGRMVTAGVLVEDRHPGTVRVWGGRPVPTYPVDEQDAARVTRAVGLLTELLIEAGARRVHVPLRGHEPVTTPGQARTLAASPVRPTDLALFTVHLMGTARMGADPARAVCDQAGAVYGAVGLHVADASLFPGPVAVNPVLTVQAVATSVAREMMARW